LFTNARLPLTAPLTDGVKVTPKEVLWLGFKVSGKLNPLKLKSDPVMLAEKMVRLAVPVLVICRF